MKPRIIFFFLFYMLLLMFYPGDSKYFHIFAYNRGMISETEKPFDIDIHPIPYVTTTANFPFVTAEGVYITDLQSFTPIYEKNTNEHLYPASTTKMITALVALDVYKPDDVITVHNPLNEGQVMGLQENEKITAENLLYGMLVYSGNDAAYAFANAYGFDKFIDRMNKKAQELGMKNTHFKNPAGLDDPDQYSTPFDLALAAREVLTHPLLKKIVSIKEITISDVDFKYFHQLENVNKLLGEIQGIGGLKTGYTENAGENLVSFYKHNDHEFLIVVLKSQDRFADTQNIVTWMNNNVNYVDGKL